MSLYTTKSNFSSWKNGCLQGQPSNAAVKDAVVKPFLQSSFFIWAPLKETLNLHLNMCLSGVSLLTLKYILITYHLSAGYQQGNWGSLFVWEGNDSSGNEDMMQEAINYFSILLKSLSWQLLKNKSFFVGLFPSFPLHSVWQQTVCDRTCTLQIPKFITNIHSIPKFNAKTHY